MFETAELGRKLSKKDYEAEVPKLRTELLRVQNELREKAAFSVVVIIGGLGSVKGAAAGSLLYGMSIAFAPAYHPLDYTYYSIILTFVILAVVLAVRPYGLFGRAE